MAPIASLVAPAGPSGDTAVLGLGAASALSLLVYLALLGRGVVSPPSVRQIVVVAALARLVVVAGPLRLDDDIWRYLWDGEVTRRGVSPYRFAPQEAIDFDPRWDRLLIDDPDEFNQLEKLHRATRTPPGADTVHRINFPHYPTIYPPTSQLLFAVTPSDERAARSVFALVDALSVLLLLSILGRLQRPAWWAIAYAWHPLPILEFASAGHQDALGIVLVLAATSAALRARPGLCGGLVGLAAGIKLFPIGLLALWRRHLGWRGLLGAAVATILLWSPFLALGPIDLSGLEAYLAHWEFFSGPYALLAGLTGGAARGIVAIAGLAALAALALRRGDDRSSVRRASLWIECLVVLSPVVDPWYVAWPLAVSSLRRSIAWPLFATVAPIAYCPAPEDGHSALLRLAVWLPFLVVWMVEIRHSSGLLGRLEG